MWTVGKLPSWIWHGRQMNKSIIEPGVTQEVGGWDGGVENQHDQLDATPQSYSTMRTRTPTFPSARLSSKTMRAPISSTTMPVRFVAGIIVFIEPDSTGCPASVPFITRQCGWNAVQVQCSRGREMSCVYSMSSMCSSAARWKGASWGRSSRFGCRPS